MRDLAPCSGTSPTVPQRGGAQACAQRLMAGGCKWGVLGELHHPLWAEVQEGSRCRGHQCSCFPSLRGKSWPPPNPHCTSWACFAPAGLSLALGERCEGLTEGPACSQGCSQCPLCAAVLTGTQLFPVPWAVGAVPRPHREDQEPWGILPPPCPGLSPTSSPSLPSCGTPALRIHHVLFFPLHFFFWGWGGGRGREDQPVNVDVR